jgi:hypothetical protein
MAGTDMSVPVLATGSWEDYAELAGVRIEVPKAGVISLSIRPSDRATWKAVNLADVRVVPVR